MINIFEVFLPQLLRYPNPNDPLNGEAAALLMRHPAEYDAKVKGKRNEFARELHDLMRKPQNTCRGSQPRKQQMLPQARREKRIRMRTKR